MDKTDNPRRKEELRKVTEQAAEWFTLFEEGDGAADERSLFVQWIAESPLHVKAFLNVTAADRLVETVALDAIDWRPGDAVAQPHGATTNILPLRAARRDDDAATVLDSRSRIRRHPLAAGLAAAAAAMLAIVGWLTFDSGNKQNYTTGIGEQRSVELADGSVVHLNAKSRLEVRFTAQARDLHLLDGEALFKVQRETARPFRVHAGATVVQAIGTQFDVDLRREQTTVSVIEGVVQVSKRSKTPTRVAAGESINVASDGRIERRAPVNTAQVTAWRQRRLVFEEDTLADIATQFNRYNRAPQLHIEGEAVRQRRYAAVFDADDPESLLQFLRKDRELTLDTRGSEIVIRAR